MDLQYKNYWKDIKNKWEHMDVSSGFLFSETIRAFRHELVEKKIDEMDSKIQELKDALNKRQFISCPCCQGQMEWIDNSMYGCGNEDCSAESRAV